MSKQLDVDVTSGARKTDLWGIFSIEREISRFMKLHLGKKKKSTGSEREWERKVEEKKGS